MCKLISFRSIYTFHNKSFLVTSSHSTIRYSQNISTYKYKRFPFTSSKNTCMHKRTQTSVPLNKLMLMCCHLLQIHVMYDLRSIIPHVMLVEFHRLVCDNVLHIHQSEKPTTWLHTPISLLIVNS